MGHFGGLFPGPSYADRVRVRGSRKCFSVFRNHRFRVSGFVIAPFSTRFSPTFLVQHYLSDYGIKIFLKFGNFRVDFSGLTLTFVDF